MSFSKNQINGENFLSRSGSFSTHPKRNGHVDVLPKHASDLETPYECLNDIRNDLSSTQGRNIERIRGLPKGAERSFLVNQNQVISSHITRINLAMKKRCTEEQSFHIVAEIMLTDKALEKVTQKAVGISYTGSLSEISKAIKGQLETAESFCKEIALFSFGAASNSPQSAEMLVALTRLSVSQKDKLAKWNQDLDSIMAAEKFKQAATEILSAQAVATIESCASARKEKADNKAMRRVISEIGGKRQFKQLIGPTGEPQAAH